MPAHKLVLEDVFEQSFKLLAIHSSVEEYKLAFLLNKHLGLKLARERKDIDFQRQRLRVLFAHFTFADESKFYRYHLVGNISKGAQPSTEKVHSLFGEEQIGHKRTYLLPEFKQVDFFLKIEDEQDTVPEKIVLEKIKGIPQVSTAYFIDFHQIKEKENLIFD